MINNIISKLSSTEFIIASTELAHTYAVELYCDPMGDYLSEAIEDYANFIIDDFLGYP